MASNRIDGEKRTVLSILATLLMILFAVFAMIPFAFMFMSSLKPGTEMMRYGLTLRFDPGISSFRNYTALNTYRDDVYWHWYKSSVIIMVLQTEELHTIPIGMWAPPSPPTATRMTC